MKVNLFKTALLLLGTLPALSVAAYDVEVDGVFYNLNYKESTATVTCKYIYNSSNAEAYVGDVVIPESIVVNDKIFDVASVDVRAFFSCINMRSILLPNSIKSISNNAFYGCTALKSIKLPKNLYVIDYSVFQECTSLEEVVFPSTLASIGPSAFAGCASLDNVILPDNCIKIDTGAFMGCVSLSNLHLPNSLQEVGFRVFSACESLESVAIPDKITIMNSYMFGDCINLKSVYVGKSVNKIEPYALSGCKKLNDIYFSSPTPPECGNSSTFRSTPRINLHVPQEGIEKFHTSLNWSEFKNILPLQCSEPNVEYRDGELHIITDTNLKYASVSETFTYSVKVSDLSEGIIADESMDMFGKMDLSYDIRVIAKAIGCSDSKEMIATLCWLEHGLEIGEGAGESDSPTQIEAAPTQRAVIVQSNGGEISVSGLDEGEVITFYDLTGRLLGRAVCSAGSAGFTATSGQVIVARVAGSSFKLRVR